MTQYTRNVEMIRNEGVRLIRGKIFREIRTELNKAVKAGELGHIKQDKLKPEAYFHPEQRAEAERQIQAAYDKAVNALSAVCC